MFKSILLPVDLATEASWKKALPAALDMARIYNAPIHVVSVLPDFGMSIVGSYFKDDFEDKALDDFGHKLADWVRSHMPNEVEVHPHVLHGSIYAEIVRAADELDTDLIVMASHRPELSDYLLGPNAARIVRHSNRTVLLVRD